MIGNHIPTPIRVGQGSGRELLVMTTRRFKTARLTVTLCTEADETQAMLCSLVCGVLRRGCEGYPSLTALNRRLDELYGTTLTVRSYLHGDTHVLALTAEMLEDGFLPPGQGQALCLLESVAEVMAHMLFHPLRDETGMLRATAVEAEKQAQTDSIRAESNDPRTYAAAHLRQIMCEGEPHGIRLGGTETAVAAVTPRVLTEAWERLLTRAVCRFAYVGRCDAPTVQAVIDQYFGHWTPIPRSRPLTVLHSAPTELRRVEEPRPVEQGRLCMGWALRDTSNAHEPLTPKEDAAMTVMAELLGGMQGSLLFRRLREELGLCYECDGVYDGEKGTWTVTCGIHPGNREAAEAAVTEVMNRLAEGEIDSDDLRMAVTSLGNGYRQMADSPAAMESFWLRRMMNGQEESPAARWARISAVTAEDVCRVAGALRPDTVYFLRGTCPADEEGGTEA